MRKKYFMMGLCFFIWNIFAIQAYGAVDDPGFIIQIGSKKIIYSRTQLLQFPKLEHITISNNRAYPDTTLTYTAIKFCHLLKPYAIRSQDILELISTDHFAVLIPAMALLNCNNNSAIAYLAIEPKKKWPVLFNHTGTTAGPYAVIWLHPEKSYISNEYWAWSVIHLKLHKQFDDNMLPPIPHFQSVEEKTMRTRLLRGRKIYVSHCAACHSINHIGKGVIGPDLNIPKNPVEYYPNDQVLKKFIRDPQSVRKIKNARMSGSGKDFLSDKDLDSLILYFHHMANYK